MTVVHYLNQFFAGLGGEEAAGHEPVRMDGPQGPGRALSAAGLPVDVTIVCGDDRFGADEAGSLARLLAWIDEAEPDVVVCGPSFGSGRYGYACGVLAREVGRRGIPVVAAMTPDSPGVLASEGAAYIVPTGSTVAGMRDAAPAVAALAARLAAGETSADRRGGIPPAGSPHEHPRRCDGRRARRHLVLAKLAGDVRTEVDPSGDRVGRPPPIADAAAACIALVTEAGCVPQGNPDRLPTRHASVWLRYPLDGVASMDAGATSRCTRGSTRPGRTSTPTDSCPLDAARALVEQGRSGGSTRSSSPRAVSTRRSRSRRGSVRRSPRRCAARASTR